MYSPSTDNVSAVKLDISPKPKPVLALFPTDEAPAFGALAKALQSSSSAFTSIRSSLPQAFPASASASPASSAARVAVFEDGVCLFPLNCIVLERPKVGTTAVFGGDGWDGPGTGGEVANLLREGGADDDRSMDEADAIVLDKSPGTS